MTPLKRIQLLAQGLLASVIILAVAAAIVLFLQPLYWMAYTPVIMAMGLVMLLYYSSAHKYFKSAQLIVENAIITIQPVVLYAPSVKDVTRLHDNSRVYISCFGIMLGTKTITFNQNGIWLRRVEIGHNYISLDYGAGSDTPETIRLLYPRPHGNELAGIIDKFCKETGITPVITQYSPGRE